MAMSLLSSWVLLVVTCPMRTPEIIEVPTRRVLLLVSKDGDDVADDDIQDLIWKSEQIPSYGSFMVRYLATY